MDVNFNGINYYIERNENESDLSLYNRILFIAKQEPKDEKELKNESKLSNIWVNSKLLGCEYSQKIQNLINTRVANL